jgi:hypothetical protein
MVEATFRRRAVAAENVAQHIDQLAKGISQIIGLWNGEALDGLTLDRGTGESAAADLSTCLVSGVTGAVLYASRMPKSIQDRAMSDDVLTLRVEGDAVEWGDFTRRVFPAVVTVFSPYRASVITDPDQEVLDFDAICDEAERTGRDIDGRDSVFRFWPVNYFDDLLCRRAFGITATELVGRLSGKIESARLVGSGALLLIVGDRIVTGEELVALNVRVREAAGLSKRSS